MMAEAEAVMVGAEGKVEVMHFEARKGSLPGGCE